MTSVEPVNEVVQEGDRRGVVDTSKVAVGGHSYGAFMAANLLVSPQDPCTSTCFDAWSQRTGRHDYAFYTLC